MDPLRPTDVKCDCCELANPEHLSSPDWNAAGLIRGWRCGMCNDQHHQGDPLKMARDHEYECRARLRETTDELYAALDQADDYRDKMKAACMARDYVLREFEKLARYHRGTDFGCICGKRNCETLAIVDVDWINDRIATMHRLDQTG